ncbi:glycosyltransferase family 1 protein [soil metagenome]
MLELVGALQERSDVAVTGVAARHAAPPPDPWRPPVAVRHLRLPRPVLYETWHALRWPAVEGATGPVDLVHATAVAVPPSRAPLVVPVHNLAFLADAAHATPHGNRFFRRGLALARRHARLVLCPSVATATECRSAGFDPARLRVVPWGVDATPAPPADVERVRATYRLDRPYVLFTGTVEPRKNLPRLLDACAALAGDPADLVLTGPSGWNEDLSPLLAGMGAGRAERVRALGFVPRADLAALLAGADVLCYPSLREGFGLPVLEAMAQGTAVVTSSGTATEEVVGDAGVLVAPLDTAAITVALGTLLADPDCRRQLGERGKAVAAEATWARTAERTVAAYREALS